jgi:hypothetical protein
MQIGRGGTIDVPRTAGNRPGWECGETAPGCDAAKREVAQETPDGGFLRRISEGPLVVPCP